MVFRQDGMPEALCLRTFTGRMSIIMRPAGARQLLAWEDAVKRQLTSWGYEVKDVAFIGGSVPAVDDCIDMRVTLTDMCRFNEQRRRELHHLVAPKFRRAATASAIVYPATTRITVVLPQNTTFDQAELSVAANDGYHLSANRVEFWANAGNSRSIWLKAKEVAACGDAYLVGELHVCTE